VARAHKAAGKKVSDFEVIGNASSKILTMIEKFIK
jgi:hypothetical protein